MIDGEVRGGSEAGVGDLGWVGDDLDHRFGTHWWIWFPGDISWGGLFPVAAANQEVPLTSAWNGLLSDEAEWGQFCSFFAK